MLKRLYDWTCKQARSPYATYVLIACSFLESIIFPPVAPLVIICSLQKPQRAFVYATIVTLFSVLGGVAAYGIGYGLWQTIGQRIIDWSGCPQAFDHFCTLYHTHQASALFVGAFLPFPFKAVALSAGFCNLPLIAFIGYTLAGRAVRYYTVALLLRRYGQSVTVFIDRWFYQLVLLFLCIMTVGFLVLLLT